MNQNAFALVIAQINSALNLHLAHGVPITNELIAQKVKG